MGIRPWWGFLRVSVEASGAGGAPIAGKVGQASEHDDANRALMGSNMQRQSVPLLYPEAPLIGTGLEGQTARDSGMTLLSAGYGKVVQINDGQIAVRDKRHNVFTYSLTKYQRSNQDTCINQRPFVSINEKVTTGQIIADGASTEGGAAGAGAD